MTSYINLISSKQRWGLPSLLLIRSSVVARALPFSIFAAALTLLWHAFLQHSLSRQMSGFYLFHVIVVIMALALMFRYGPLQACSRLGR
jgi:urea transporter